MAEKKRFTVKMAAQLLGVGATCIQVNMQLGNLPIGFCYESESGKRHNFYISPLKFMMYSGIKKEAIERECNIDLSDYIDIEDWMVMEGAVKAWEEKRERERGIVAI